MKSFLEFLSEDLQPVYDAAASHKVTIKIDSDKRDPTLKLDWIKRNGKQGSGAKVMKVLHQVADKHKRPIKLFARHPKLEVYYKKLGYKKTGQAGYFGTMPEMVRKPKK